jgi:hypothetical protein
MAKTILLRDFDAKEGKENILKSTVWIGGLHETDDENGVRVVSFVTSKKLAVKSLMFLNRNNSFRPILMERLKMRSNIF